MFRSTNNNPYSQNTLLVNHPSLSQQTPGACYHLRIPDNLGMSSSAGSTSTDRLTSTAGMLKSGKTIPEVYLTRLLSTKGTIKKFIDDFFATILSVDGIAPDTNCDDTSFPPAVKWLFDLFDAQAARFGGSGFAGAGGGNDGLDGGAAAAADAGLAGVVHSWKSNSVPLRFWINLIKNPDFVFDVEKTPATDLNLSIVAQTLMSACLNDDPAHNPVSLNKESPSHKLLFARDIAGYRARIADFYERVRGLPAVTDQDLGCYMNRLSQMHRDEFNQMAALKEVFLYVSQYYHELSMAFNTDSGNGTLVGNGGSGGLHSAAFVPSPTLSNYSAAAAAATMQHNNHAAQTNRDLSMKLEHIFKIVKESDYVR